MATSEILTAAEIESIAAAYGFNASDRIVRENAEQAVSAHGELCRGFDGDLKRFWLCDSSGRINARRLLCGLLEQVSNDMNCDARAHSDFCRHAYG